MKRTLTKLPRAKPLVLPLKNLGTNPEFIKLIAEARAAIAAGQKYSLEEVMQEFAPKHSAKRRSKLRKRSRK